jgi:5-oxoprolinase (ATP-hydrolysing) subunit A
MKIIDLNSDIGESFGAFKVGNDVEVLKYITSANIACGYHAGDHNVMFETVRLAQKNGVKIGAHPGFPDLAGFGRREMNLSTREIYNLIIYQIGALQAVCKVNGTSLSHVKPHGALYNVAARNREIADAIADAIVALDSQLVLFGLAGSEIIKAGRQKGLQVAEEVFTDRTYQPDGTLTSRRENNAFIHNPREAIQRVTRMVTEGKVKSVDGTDLDIQADTICVHGDGPKAVEFVSKLKKELEQENIFLRKRWSEQ